MVGTPTPKDRFTSLDTLALVRELRALGRARIDKAFDLPSGGWTLVLRVAGEGRRELELVPGRYGALVAPMGERAGVLSPFAKELRRLLTGATLRSVAEPAGERLLELTFSRSDESAQFLVAFEMFGSGNLLVAQDGKIVAVAHPRQWAHRSVRIGAPYLRPPARLDPWFLSAAQVESELARSRTDLASTLAARLGLGGPVAEELIARGGWNPEEPAAPGAGRLGRPLHDGLQSLLAEVGERPSGYLYLRGELAVDATPYSSHRWREAPGVEEARRPTFSEAARVYFASLVPTTWSEEEVEIQRAHQELERLAARQRASVEEFAKTAELLRAQAEAILAHYAEAERFLAGPPSRTEVAARIEVVLGTLPVPLLVGRTPRESAQGLFEEAKRVVGKLSRARAALAETERKLSGPMPAPTSTPRAVRPARRATHWFEKFRWFISSEGAVVVGGRDASTNDLLVKRHLKDGDTYVHADLHGAASVIVKHPEARSPPASETTYREAGQWAVAFSKAWRAGLASASAFWVTSDQVSKAGASGEFVARGAWVIHGTKNFLHDLPTELALGTIVYDGETLWTIAPEAAVRARGVVRLLFTPGPERERPEREAELARELGIPRSLLQSLLPAGGFTARRP